MPPQKRKAASPEPRRRGLLAKPTAKKRKIATPAKRKFPSPSTSPSPEPGKKAGENNLPEPTIVIGIDFGTTYSGVAYTWSGSVEKLQVIMSWDDTNEDQEKVPSAIDFPKIIGDEHSWGAGANKAGNAAKWFKLLLIDEEDLPEDVRESDQFRRAREQLRSVNKTPVEVISFFLRSLWNHCIKVMTEAEGKEVVNNSRFHVVLTLPAIWPMYARHRMQEAATQAGIIQDRLAGATKLTFVSEPEGAALATLSDIGGRQDIKENDSFVVVDCGGGTVDLISYKVTSIEPMAVRECVEGQGGLCGAVFVDNAFITLLKRKFGEETWNRISASDLADIMGRDWETGIRHQFTGQPRSWTVRQPYDSIDEAVKKIGGAQPKITITADEVRDVFQPVVTKIQTLVNAQIASVLAKESKLPKYIIMVGGFGRCRYLYEVLKDACQGVEVLQARGSGPWTAICRGAVIHALQLENLRSGLSVGVQSRVSRASYGIRHSTKFDPRKHKEADKVWDEIEGVYKVRNMMKWFIKQGDNVSDKQPVREAYYRLLDSPSSSIENTIYMSRARPPPKQWDTSVINFCDVKWDTTVDITTLPPFTSPAGKIYSELSYEIEMTCTGGSIEVGVFRDGKRQASKNISVDFQDRGGLNNGSR